MLRNKANHDILEGFLSVLLKQDLKVLSVLESESNQEYPTDKFNRVDLVVEDENKEIVVVEVQNNREVHYLESRLAGLYGSSKLIVGHVQLGESYAQVRKIISIGILYFLLGEGETDYVYHGRTEFHGLNDHSRLELKRHRREALVGAPQSREGNVFPEYYLIELERFRDVVKSDLDEWIYFFKNSEIKDEFKSRNIQKARERLDLLKMPEAERKAYEKFLMNKMSEKGMLESARIEGEIKGEIKGESKGKIEGKIEVAQSMLAGNEPLEKIKRYTNLSEEELLQLKSRP